MYVKGVCCKEVTSDANTPLRLQLVDDTTALARITETSCRKVDPTDLSDVSVRECVSDVCVSMWVCRCVLKCVCGCI